MNYNQLYLWILFPMLRVKGTTVEFLNQKVESDEDQKG